MKSDKRFYVPCAYDNVYGYAKTYTDMITYGHAKTHTTEALRYAGYPFNEPTITPLSKNFCING
jgi:hypothetical protein